MNISDIANGLFELGGAFFLWKNVQAIRRDKTIQGVNWTPTIWFTAWGFFNLWFYPFNGLWLSFMGGVAIVTINSIWLYHVWKYHFNKHITWKSLFSTS